MVDMNPNELRPRVQMAAPEFAAKFKSKREIYTFLTIDANAYLPPIANVTIYFLKDIIGGKRKCKYSAKFSYG